MAVHLLCQKKAPLCTVFGECCLLGRINALFGRLIASFGTVTAFLGTLTALLGKLSALLCQNGAVSLRIDQTFSIGIQNVFHWNSKSNPLDFANDLSGRVPHLHPSVTTLQAEVFSQMANVGGDATFDSYAKQTGGVTFLNKSLAPVGGVTVGESARTAGMLREAMPKRLRQRPSWQIPYISMFCPFLWKKSLFTNWEV